MKKFEIVKEHKDFDDIIQNSPYLKNKYYIIYYKERDLGFPRFGIAVGKKIGNAVTRNRVKRQIRALIDKNKKLFQNDRDYIIIVKKDFLNLSYQEATEELISLIGNRR